MDEDVEVNDAQVVYPTDCMVLEIQHRHGSQLLAGVMDRWLSNSRFGSNRLPGNPRLTNFIRFLRITYIHPSESLELKQRGLVSPLVPLVP